MSKEEFGFLPSMIAEPKLSFSGARRNEYHIQGFD
jgi:hypothetical protein